MKRFIQIGLTLLFSLVMFALMTSCKGDPGPVGPQGPQGDPGNSNVTMVNVSFTVADAGIDVSSQGFFDVNVPEITQGIVDDGAVLVFTENIAGNGQWIAMPFTVITGGNSYSYNFWYELTNVHFFYQTTASSWFLSGSFVLNYRIFIFEVPPSITIVDITDYEAVKAYYNLSD